MTPLKLLLVEDSQDDADLVIRQLTKGGFQVHCKRVASAGELEGALGEGGWDVLISDYNLPGFDCLKALAMARERSARLPCIVVSGTVGEETAVSTLKAGAHDYLMKGALTRLVPAVSRALDEVRNREALTEKEEQLRQATKMEAVGRLAGGIAHDFNNILTVILMHCEHLLTQVQPATTVAHEIEQIKAAGARAAGLTRQLLAFSRKQPLELQRVDLNGVASNLEKMLRRLIGEDIQMTTQFESKLFGVRADPNQIEQILMNLVVNARDAMPQGGELRLSTKNAEVDAKGRPSPDLADGSYAVIEVTDTGTGIAPEILKKIFDPFFTTKGPNRGTGLGLSTVYGIAKQGRGCVAVTSELGKGTTFSVYLPKFTEAAAAKAAAQALPAAAAARVVPKRKTAKVLLVEDQPDLREIVVHVLTKAGYEVTAPESALEAVETGKANAYDIVISDVVMPQLNGPELVKQLLISSPQLKVIFMSGYLDIDTPQLDSVQDRSLFLQKPFTMGQIVSKVQEALS